MGTKRFYMGKRANRAGVLKHTMLEGETVYTYTTAKDRHFWGVQIGAEYENEGEGERAGEFVLPQMWAKCATGTKHPETITWQAEHALAIEQNKAKNKEVSPELAAHVKAIRDACGRMSTNQRAAFLARLIQTFMSWR